LEWFVSTLRDTKSEGKKLVAYLDVLQDDFTTSIQHKKHSCTQEDSENIGGKDLGSSASKFLSTILTICKVLTLKSDAARKMRFTRSLCVSYLFEKRRGTLKMDASRRLILIRN
jgi:putative redox protein